jgi:hypothetical protein
VRVRPFAHKLVAISLLDIGQGLFVFAREDIKISRKVMRKALIPVERFAIPVDL